jgi:hypothetical protein
MEKNNILALVAGVLLGLIIGWVGRGEYQSRQCQQGQCPYNQGVNINVPGFEGQFCVPGDPNCDPNARRRNTDIKYPGGEINIRE